MGKAAERVSNRIHANTSRRYTGMLARGVAGVLKAQLWAFAGMLQADNCNGLSDAEVRHIKQARKEVRTAMKRLNAIAERCDRE